MSCEEQIENHLIITITICPQCVYDLYRLQRNFNWRYAQEGYNIYGLAPSTNLCIQ